MAKSTKSSKASDFDADKFLAEMEEQSRKEKEAAQKKEALIKEYSIQWNMNDENPPLPGMRLNAWRCRWEPENLDRFIREHGEDFRRFRNARMDNQVDSQNPEQAIHEESEIPSASETSEAVQQEYQCTDTTVTPAAEAKSKPKAEPSPKVTVSPENRPEAVCENPAPAASEAATASNEPVLPADKAVVEGMEQSRNTRVSSKMVNAGFDELTREFLHISSLGEKKPVFLPLELRNALETLARLSGVPNLAPSHIVINVLKAFFDEHRDLINRKLSGMKLSI